MSTLEHIIVFSHGFGVRKDDRGLFTDIAAALPDAVPVMFDYNYVDEANNTLTTRPFSEQAQMLRTVVEEQKSLHPGAVIDIVAHSQGCRIAAIAHLLGIRKVILIAPPMDVGIERSLSRYRSLPGTVIDLDGMTRLPRTDGSMTLVPAAYWKERQAEGPPVDSYTELAKHSDVTVIQGNQDTVLGESSLDGLSTDVHVISMDGDHDFTGSARAALLDVITRTLEV